MLYIYFVIEVHLALNENTLEDGIDCIVNYS